MNAYEKAKQECDAMSEAEHLVFAADDILELLSYAISEHEKTFKCTGAYVPPDLILKMEALRMLLRKEVGKHFREV